MEIGQLRFFVAVVDGGSLSSAARELQLSLPAASRKLRQLEERLGTRLLQRTTRRQMLTDEGQLLYQSALRILADLEQVEQQLLNKSAIVSGQLRITTPLSLGRRVIAPLLAEFRSRHPALQIQIMLTDSVLNLVDAGVDLAVRFGALDDSSYISHPLAPNYRVLCASPDYLQAHGEPQTPSDLLQHQCLHLGAQAQAEWRIGEQSVRFTAWLSADDGGVTHQWTLAGYGIALKSIWDVAQDLQDGRLKQVLADYPIPAAPLHAVYPNRHQLAPRVRECIRFLADRLQQLAPVAA